MPAKIKLALEGGGGKGIAFCGALRALAGMGVTFEELAGTSAGAITAALLAAGYTADELENVVSPCGSAAVDWNRFKDLGNAPRIALWTGIVTSFAGTVFELTEGWWHGVYLTPPDWATDPVLASYAIAGALGAGALAWFGVVAKRFHWGGGIFLGNAFERWMRQMLRRKLKLDRDVLFRDLPVPLTVVASDLAIGNMRVIYFSLKNTPDFPVHKAVRASMSLPLIYVPVRVGFSYPGKPEYDSVLLDGGALSNLPLDAFADKLGRIPKNAFGLLLDEGPPQRCWRHRVVPTMALLHDLAELARTHHDSTVRERYADQIVRLPVGDYPTAKFQPTAAEYKRLTDAAFGAVERHGGLKLFLKTSLLSRKDDR